jgi:hypothetical protein
MVMDLLAISMEQKISMPSKNLSLEKGGKYQYSRYDSTTGTNAGM